MKETRAGGSELHSVQYFLFVETDVIWLDLDRNATFIPNLLRIYQQHT